MEKQHLNAGNVMEEFEEIEEIMGFLETSLIWFGVNILIIVFIVSFAIILA